MTEVWWRQPSGQGNEPCKPENHRERLHYQDRKAVCKVGKVGGRQEKIEDCKQGPNTIEEYEIDRGRGIPEFIGSYLYGSAERKKKKKNKTRRDNRQYAVKPRTMMAKTNCVARTG